MSVKIRNKEEKTKKGGEKAVCSAPQTGRHVNVIRGALLDESIMEPSHAASSHQKSHQCIKKRYSLGSDKLILSSSPPDFSGIIIHPPPPSAEKKKKHPSGEKWKKLFILTQLCLAKLLKLTCTLVFETQEDGGVRQRGRCSRAPCFFTVSLGKFFNLSSYIHIV